MSDCTKGCDASCNSECGCGSTHHHCGCPCHTHEAALDEQHQHAERQATHWLARYQELCTAVGRVPGDIAAPDEAAQMRAVIEAMRPIVEAAMHYIDLYPEMAAQADRGTMVGLALANRERLGLAMSAWCNSQTLTAEEREKRNASMLTADEREALLELRTQIEGGARALNRQLGAHRLAIAASALAKLTEQGGGR